MFVRSNFFLLMRVHSLVVSLVSCFYFSLFGDLIMFWFLQSLTAGLRCPITFKFLAHFSKRSRRSLFFWCFWTSAQRVCLFFFCLCLHMRLYTWSCGSRTVHTNPCCMLIDYPCCCSFKEGLDEIWSSA